MLKHSVKTAALVAATFATFGSAQATPLPVGSPPIAIDTADLPAGSFLASAIGTVNGGGFTGTARTAVYRETATGQLDFIYQFTDLVRVRSLAFQARTLIISSPTCFRILRWRIRAVSS